MTSENLASHNSINNMRRRFNEVVVRNVFSLTLIGAVTFGFVAICSSVAIAQLKQTDVGDGTAVAKKVGELVKALDSNRLNERDRAEEQLLELGTLGLEFLPAVSDDQSPELLMRLERIRSKIDSKDSHDVMQPRTLTLSGRVSGRDALDKLAESTGNKLTVGDSERLQQMITADFKSTPYWEALDEILDQLGLSILPYDGIELELVETDPQSTLRITSAAYCGAFRLEPIRVNKNSDLVSPWKSNLTLSLLISWEPRLSPSVIQLDPSNFEFECDSGEVLEFLDDSPIIVMPSGGSQAVVDIECRMPSARARSVVNWSGDLEALLPGPLATVSFSDLSEAEGKNLTNGMLSVTVESIRKNRTVQEITFAVSIKSDSEIETEWEAIATMCVAYVLDPKGAKIENVGWSSDLLSENRQGFTYLFDLSGEIGGHRLNFRAPSSIRKGRSPFEGGEIPIP